MILGLPGLEPLLGDSELRSQLMRVVTRKIQTDLKMLHAYNELARHLTDNRRRGQEGGSLKQIVSDHLQYFGALLDLNDSFHQHLLDVLALDRPQSADGGGINTLTLDVKAPAGATIRAPFKVSNTRADHIRAICKNSPFVSEDGGQLIGSTVTFDPADSEIPAQSEQIFVAIVPIGPEFVVGQRYFSTISVDGVDAIHIVLRLQIEPPPVEPEKPAIDTAATPKKPRAPRKKVPIAPKSVAAKKAAPKKRDTP